MCSNVYDDVIDLEVSGFAKNKKAQYLENKILSFVLPIKKSFIMLFKYIPD